MRKLSISLIALLLVVFVIAQPSAAQTRRLGPKARAAVTIGSGAAIGAGVGALVKGKKGAAIGALLGGGGTAAVYLLKNRNNDNRSYRGNSDNRYYRNNGNHYSRNAAYNNGRGRGYANGRRCRR